MKTGRLTTLAAAAAAGALLLAGAPARAADPLLEEAVEFTGAVMYLDFKVPGVVLGVIRNGETAVMGFGELYEGAGVEPDGNTKLRIGSISKAMTGQVLASLVADGTVAFTDTAAGHLAKAPGWADAVVPQMDGRQIRLIDLATHSAGLMRDAPREPGPPEDPERNNTIAAAIAALKTEPLLFAPGTGALYSNLGFDLLGAAMEGAAGKSYAELLKERVLDPAGMKDTGIATARGMPEGHMLGQGFQGEQIPAVPAAATTAPAGGLVSTPNDILRWMAWHLGDLPDHQAEVRLLDHAAYIPRDRLAPAYGLDESGHADALGLGWIVMLAEGERPTLLQKAGGGNGIFTYMAFAPGRDIGAFVAINSFDFGAAMGMAEVVNGLIAQLSPR
ncbi:D-alanyl-D-alanine-carboxypeptidase/endopeptidase AmpH [Marinibaculum pumilum]|uniref:D-alanyl-D-alanine-carboxypeptidase/endopeptidase AmpH n=1 Tax=Marinibaculum pumilum TaxID=1766165 RepID=A0ABV7L0F7_9PROT